MTAPQTITIRIPMKIRKRGGRKLILTPDGDAPAWSAPRPRVDNTMVKAIARAFRWRRLLERGDYASIAELAAAEKINATYVGRVLRLTLLAPEIIQAVMEGRQPARMTMAALLAGFPVLWAHQGAVLGVALETLPTLPSATSTNSNSSDPLTQTREVQA